MSEPKLRGNWNYPTPIRFGAGRVDELPDACLELAMHRPLVVTDPGLAELPMLARVSELLKAAGLPSEVFCEVQGNPVESNVKAGVEAFRDGGHDGVVAVGGGSALDAAKAVALMVGQHRPLFDFEDRDDWFTRVDVDGMAPVVALPTTSGTGSEVGRASVITDERDHTKKIIFHPHMLPGRVILDPELTIGLPAALTAAVGMDALSHNLEAFCSPVYHPMAQGIAVEGMKLIRDWLPRAVADGTDAEARAHMQVASTMGATAFQKGLGAMHALSHPCGAVLNTHHGLTNAVVMPYVLEFNREAVVDRLTDLARYLGLADPSFEAVLDWVLELRTGLKIPHTLTEIGVGAEHAAPLSLMAEVDPSAGTNPIKLTAANCEQLYRRAMEGVLSRTA